MLEMVLFLIWESDKMLNPGCKVTHDIHLVPQIDAISHLINNKRQKNGANMMDAA